MYRLCCMLTRRGVQLYHLEVTTILGWVRQIRRVFFHSWASRLSKMVIYVQTLHFQCGAARSLLEARAM